MQIKSLDCDQARLLYSFECPDSSARLLYWWRWSIKNFESRAPDRLCGIHPYSGVNVHKAPFGLNYLRVPNRSLFACFADSIHFRISNLHPTRSAAAGLHDISRMGVDPVVLRLDKLGVSVDFR